MRAAVYFSLRRKFVRTRIQQLARKGEELLRKFQHKTYEISQVDGILLVDLYDHTPYFRETITCAIKLIKGNDPRRFARLRRHISWIVNARRPFGGAAYYYGTRMCEIDFQQQLRSEYEVPVWAAWYACTLVHEATHGVLLSRGVPYTSDENGIQIEKLCKLEEARFARHLQIDPRIVAWLQPKLQFDPALWHRVWAYQKFTLTCRRSLSRYCEEERQRHAEKTRIPNGSP